jgi:alkanesulfonate monooxygenase SsuD/methylene tetrahydromethanopterin reductase-like flavin-dependent oxidoreductase (luciferase family)
MMEPGRSSRATYSGEYVQIADATNVPKPIQQPRVPIMVGGNGPKVTWRLAARYADELNLDGMDPTQTAAALPVIAARCEEVGRDPSTLRVSVHQWWGNAQPSGPAVQPATPGSERIDRLGQYRELGVSRVMELVRASVDGDEALGRYAEDCAQAGVELAPR